MFPKNKPAQETFGRHLEELSEARKIIEWYVSYVVLLREICAMVTDECPDEQFAGRIFANYAGRRLLNWSKSHELHKKGRKTMVLSAGLNAVDCQVLKKVFLKMRKWKQRGIDVYVIISF